LDALRQEARELARDMEMMQRLEEALLESTAIRNDTLDTHAAEKAYAEAFAWYGLDVAGFDPSEVGPRMQARPIGVQLAAHLDCFALMRWKLRLERWPDLVAAARIADPDPWRHSLRDQIGHKDADALEELAVAAPPGELHSARVVLLVHLKLEAGAPRTSDRVTDLLIQARERHPADFWVNHYLGMLYCESSPPRYDEASRYLTAAVAIRPTSPAARLNLGLSLEQQGLLDQAITEYREAIHLRNDYAMAHFGLGLALKAKGRLDEAIVAFRQAVGLKNDFSKAHANLGIALADKGQLDDALLEFREVVRISPREPSARLNLGNCLCRMGRLDDSIAELRKAIDLKFDLWAAHSELGLALNGKGQHEAAIAECRLAIEHNPKDAVTHNNLGACFYDNHQLDEAITEFGLAVQLNKDDAKAHNNLGLALMHKGRLDEAIEEFGKSLQLKYERARLNLGIALLHHNQLDEAIKVFRETLRVKKDHPVAHCNLGAALVRKGRLDEAVDELREATRLKKDFVEAHANLGQALLLQQRFAEARESLGRCLDLLPPNHRMRAQVSRKLEQCKRLLALEEKLADALTEKIQPDAAERLELAQFCQEHKKLYATAVQWYAQAFAAQLKLVDEVKSLHRYNAACAAALAGCGHGADAAKLDDAERVRLRRQALDWLRADLKAWGQLLDREPEKTRATAQKMLRHWQQDPDFAGVRGDALAKLPEAERQSWRQLWQDVEQTLKKAGRGDTEERKKDASK
jgi:tetratricopeptide (TPR) repeat protein